MIANGQILQIPDSLKCFWSAVVSVCFTGDESSGRVERAFCGATKHLSSRNPRADSG